MKNKYIRNRSVKNKDWNRAKKIVGGEFSQKLFFPYWLHGVSYTSANEQLLDHQTWISEHWVRTFLSGNHRGCFHAPKFHKKEIERSERRKVQQAINKMMQNIDDVDDIDIPKFIHQADWDWF